jgi:hypothetical protein
MNSPVVGRDRRVRVAALLVAVVCASCAYTGRNDAISHRFTWFSYLNGDDIRKRCGPGALDRYRFVYNGVYVKQVRTYDIVPSQTTDGYVLTARVLGPSDLSAVVINNPIDTITEDPLSLLAPFAGTSARIGLGGRDLDVLDQALTQSGFFQPPPKGLYIHSDDFFWIGVACIGGRLTFNAWRYPSPQFDALTFPALVFSWDETGIAVNPPRDLSPFQIYGDATTRDTVPHFTLTVGDDGLEGVGTLF